MFKYFLIYIIHTFIFNRQWIIPSQCYTILFSDLISFPSNSSLNILTTTTTIIIIIIMLIILYAWILNESD
ncbi:hypothetical protein BJ944DRAFT_262964 [Cunninghamella echinulata]|nr:hypothetical protein BJ944DRAFT_262964 [Cunninghamella echinulata]